MLSPVMRALPGDSPWRTLLPHALRLAYIATIFLSALLLFAVQPMLTKMVLPKLGGSPSVWAVSMCFFQGALLVGYIYAFVLNQRASARKAVLVHLAVLAVACLALPVALPDSAVALFGGGSYYWLVVVLAMAVGLPFLAVSANAPLLQAWFARTGHPDAHEPYFLYRASNAGSLAALLAYPVLFEPMLALSTQTAAWGIGFVLLAAMIALCGTLMLATPGKQVAVGAAGTQGDDASTALVDWRQRAAWVGLAFVPSGLLVAFTTFLTTDVASSPFLWVAPLAIFLGTFILVFRPWHSPAQRWLEAAQPLIVAVALVNQSDFARISLPVDAAIGLAAFVATCLVCHRRLYQSRPAASHLTEFYLWMSFGGVLGGISAGVAAPQLFSTPIEYPLLLALGVAWQLPQVLKRATSRVEVAAVGVAVAAFGGIVLVIAMGWLLHPTHWQVSTRTWVLLAVVVAFLPMLRFPKLRLGTVALTAVIVTAVLGHGHTYSGRSFFGVHRVAEQGDFRLYFHGTTLHGAQRLRSAWGGVIPPTAPPPPVTYFHPASTHVLGLELTRKALHGAERAPSVGIIGLGVGAMACHARPGERWRFFEIDPLVVEMAKDRRFFTYLSNCAEGADVVLGDARITLGEQQDGSFDYLLFDAFTSDAVPVHLLTVEAIRLYFDKLSDRGVLALHVSNKHLDLVQVVAANLESIGGLSALLFDNPGQGNKDALAARVVLVARHPVVLAPAAASPHALPLVSLGVRPWTDDFSNVASALVRHYLREFRDQDNLDVEYFSAVIAKFPKHPVGYKRRSEVSMARRDYAAAIEDLTTMMRLFPNDMHPYKVRGVAHQRNGNAAGAIADLNRYLFHRPADAAALEMRGMAYANLGAREDAMADFRRVLALDPGKEVSRKLLTELEAAR
ncbi:MAG TPA: tetratricopeptide repeat protein [Hyphomicrobiaceae bacterium]|nr:tetratricopeptide repeat protein [Hyphomicrobiaceae bacterium]